MSGVRVIPGQWRRKVRGACSLVSTALLAAVSFAIDPQTAVADEGGVSFWIPGFFGSMAATPQQPGLNWGSIYYHTSVSAGSEVSFSRQVTRGNITVNLNGNAVGSLKADADIGIAIPTYVFAQPVLGGQAAMSLLVPIGRNTTSVDATLNGQLGPIPFNVSAGRTDTAGGLGDLIPQFSLRWNAGVHNFMTYMTGGIPVGVYDPRSLANMGIGHAAIDGGGGYTYFNPQTGHELSGMLGFTYNFKNTQTQYQSGVDMHFDWGASQFLNQQVHVGLVGYAYQQLTNDSGSGDRVSDFKSRVFGVGPQIGYIFPIGDAHRGYVNLKGYKEFGAENRPEGWNLWLTFVVSPAGAPPAAVSARR
jgi:hypothetical protein